MAIHLYNHGSSAVAVSKSSLNTQTKPQISINIIIMLTNQREEECVIHCFDILDTDIFCQSVFAMDEMQGHNLHIAVPQWQKTLLKYSRRHAMDGSVVVDT